MPRLQNTQTFPTLNLRKVGGGSLSLPDDVAGRWTAVLVYRGAWCPYCAAQLAAFSRTSDSLREAGIDVVALSVDDEATSAATVAKHRITFPVAHSAAPYQVAHVLGSYLGDHGDGTYLQSTGFLLTPESTVAVAVYSSDAIGRLTAPDVLGYVKHVRGED